MAQQPPLSDEDLEAFASELQQEIIKDPPIRCGMSFHWNGTQDHAERVRFQLVVQSALLRHESPWLDFSSLKSIVFHRDYEQGLREASTRAGRDLIPTREPGGFSFAMLVHAADGCELVANASLALGLLSEESSQRDVCVSTLRHELCHVDDFQRKSRLWKSEWLKERLDGVSATFFPMAESLWSEYYANRVSDGPLADAYLTGEEDMLAGAIRDAAQEIEEAILAFRISHDMGALAPLASRKVPLWRCQWATFLCEGSCLCIGGTTRNSTPTQNHRLFDRHCAIQVGNQLSVRQLWQIRVRRLSTALDLMQGLITDPHERANLQVRSFLAGSDNVASLGNHHEATNLLLRQLRALLGSS